MVGNRGRNMPIMPSSRVMVPKNIRRYFIIYQWCYGFVQQFAANAREVMNFLSINVYVGLKNSLPLFVRYNSVTSVKNETTCYVTLQNGVFVLKKYYFFLFIQKCVVHCRCLRNTTLIINHFKRYHYETIDAACAVCSYGRCCLCIGSTKG